MPNDLIGGNLPNMHALDSQFKRQAATVDELMATLNSEVHSTWWKGGAADRFREAWETDFQPALKRLSEALVDASKEIRTRADLLYEVGH